MYIVNYFCEDYLFKGWKKYVFIDVFRIKGLDEIFILKLKEKINCYIDEIL